MFNSRKLARLAFVLGIVIVLMISVMTIGAFADTGADQSSFPV